MSDLDSTTPTKVCTKCGREYPATLEYFYALKSGKYGLQSQCKECRGEYDVAYNAKHREERAAYRADHSEERRAYNAAYLAAHREEGAAIDAAYRVTYREELAAYRAEHRDEAAAYRVERRDETAAYAAAYRAEHLEEKAACERNRKARKLGNGGTHTAADVRAQYARQKGICFWCPEKVGDTYHVDHVMPVILGGPNGPENIVIACPTCNLSKGPKHPMDFCGRLL